MTLDDVATAIDQYLESDRGSYEKIKAANDINDCLKKLQLGVSEWSEIEKRILQADWYREHDQNEQMEEMFGEILNLLEVAFKVFEAKVSVPALVAAGLRIL